MNNRTGNHYERRSLLARMKILTLEESMLRRLNPLITNYRFVPYNEYDIEQSRLVAYVIDEISSVLSPEGNLILVAEEMGELVALVSLSRLDWDTKHFGIEMAKIGYLIAEREYTKSFDAKSLLLSHLLKECSEKQIDHITAIVHTEDTSSVHALESKGFRIMDTRVTYSFDFRKSQVMELKNQFYVREFRQNDVPKLADIALESFGKGRIATDRFHADPSLAHEKSDELYVEWIVNSCKGLADTVLVAEKDEKPVGYITCKVHRSLSEKLGERFGSIVINAVSPSTRRKGVFSSMLNAALRWLAKRVDIVEVGTQISNPIQRIWSRFGLTLVRSQYVLAYSNQKGC